MESARRDSRCRAWLALGFMSIGLAACGGGGGSSDPIGSAPPPPAPAPAPAPPAPPASLALTSLSPAAGAGDAEISTPVEAVFSQPLQAASVNAFSFTLAALPSRGRVRSAVTLNGAKATLSPSLPLSLLTRYEVGLSNTIASTSGLIYAGSTSTFTTRDGAWETAQTVSVTGSANAGEPSIAVDPSGNAVAVWHQYGATYRSIWTSRFAANTGTWSAAHLLETDDAGEAVYPKLAVSAGGDAMVVWIQNDGLRDNIWANRFSSGSWGTAELIAGPTGLTNQPHVAMDVGGNAMAVWVQTDLSRNFKVFANRFDAASGAWTGPVRIENGNTGNADAPKVVIDQAGNATAVWVKDDGTVKSVWASRYLAASAAWSVPTLLESDDSGTAVGPDLAVDVAGNVVVLWWQSNGTRFNVFSNRFSAMTDTWRGPVALEPDVGTGAGSSDAKVAVNASGQAVAIWSRTEGTNTKMRTARLPEAAGAWEAAKDISSAGDPRHAQIGMDNAGNALAVWSQQQRGGVDFTVASRFNALTATWAAPVVIQKGGAASASDAPAIAVNALSGRVLAVWPEVGGAALDIVAAWFK